MYGTTYKEERKKFQAGILILVTTSGNDTQSYVAATAIGWNLNEKKCVRNNTV